jgi:hypothetical protein
MHNGFILVNQKGEYIKMCIAVIVQSVQGISILDTHTNTSFKHP